MDKLWLEKAEQILEKMEKAIMILDCGTGEVLRTNACADRLFCNHNQHRCFSKYCAFHLFKDEVFDDKKNEFSFFCGGSERIMNLSKVKVEIEGRKLLILLIEPTERDSKNIILRPEIKFNLLNKSAVFVVKNSANLISRFGYEKYRSAIMSEINSTILYFSGSVRCYELNYKMFLFSLKVYDESDEFERKIEQIVEKRVMETNKEKIPVVFDVVISYENDEKQILKTVFEKIEQENEVRFKLTGGEKKESEIIKVLKYAIENKKVLPYYHGIYDNRKNKIEKYEALMRVEDENGKIYSPADFMEIARRYNLYKILTQLLVDRVLSDFELRKEEVGINLSEINMTCENFSAWFWRRVEKFWNKRRLILEILETEKIDDWDKVNNFVVKAKSLGIKIAIDDFGSGYSNLNQLLKLRPDLIKIDGEIMRNIDDTYNMVILKTVKFMGSNIGTELIAEYVENRFIQDVVVAERIRYSQGYYFAKPIPIEKLDKHKW